MKFQVSRAPRGAGPIRERNFRLLGICAAVRLSPRTPNTGRRESSRDGGAGRLPSQTCPTGNECVVKATRLSGASPRLSSRRELPDRVLWKQRVKGVTTSGSAVCSTFRETLNVPLLANAVVRFRSNQAVSVSLCGLLSCCMLVLRTTDEPAAHLISQDDHFRVILCVRSPTRCG